MRRLLITCALLSGLAACARTPAGLAIGAAAPEFSLPGIDGKTHSLGEYKKTILVIVFTCNSCPASQLYESRLQRLFDDYQVKGVDLVAINPQRPAALTPADLGHSDVGESLDDMKTRASHRRLTYPYLSAADAASVVEGYQVENMPQVFVFDQARTLRYRGPIDDNIREDQVTSRGARAALDALVAKQPVSAPIAAAPGCPVIAAGRTEATAPEGKVAVAAAGPDQLKALRKNGTGKLLLVNFWATWCAPCVAEFPDLEMTYRMYKGRGMEFVAVSVNDPEERPAVVEFLQKNNAAHRNYQFATADVYGLQAAFDPKMPAPVPFTLLLAPNGDVLYQELGGSDINKLRRAILAGLPEDPKYPGQRAYWSATP
jgi:thiol-disulfide isomerase/thioredoxin